MVEFRLLCRYQKGAHLTRDRSNNLSQNLSSRAFARAKARVSLGFAIGSRLSCLMFMGLAWNSLGCVVGQPPGKGQMFYLAEAKTGTGYYLYLPEDYIQSEGLRPPDKKWPIVVSFHGMRPWDSAGAQLMEWQQEADRYGYVVIAPNTRVSDLLGEIPIRRISPSLKKDEQGILAVLDEVYETLDVDPNHVLSTSWSMGGYLAHYMLNRHPDRFSCLAVRQSNFSADILDPQQVPLYRDSKIAVFYTQHDFGICQRESQEAIAWYTQRGFDTTSGIVESLGHERTPQTAAAFFAKTCNAVAKTPPLGLAQIRLSPVPAVKVASMVQTQRRMPPQPQTRTQNTAPPLAQLGRPNGNSSRQDMLYGPSRRTDTAGARKRDAHSTVNNWRKVGPTPGRSNSTIARKKTSPPFNRSTQSKYIPARPLPPPAERNRGGRAAKRFAKDQHDPDLNPLTIRLSAHIGISPMLMSYTVHIPPQMRKGADVLWIDNGEPISRGISGQKTLTKPGQHKIEVLVVTRDNREFRADKTITVLERLSLDDDESG